LILDGNSLLTETVHLDHVNEDYQDRKKMTLPVCRWMVDKTITLTREGHPGYPQLGESSYASKFDQDFRWIDLNATALSKINDKVRSILE
jgi:hypothetical protein